MAFESSEHIDSFKQLIREVPDVKQSIISALQHPNPQQHFGLKLRCAINRAKINLRLAVSRPSRCAGCLMCCTTAQFAVMHLLVNQSSSLTVSNSLLKK